ncbi:ABC transporter ATP-binding protein [Candidatus Defluviicoccus seviourii]|uniref:ABC transporter ATP-binding protein n=2 Tax=root TaxID=1 RepID=A0A564WDB4_9PROT|nr:ABC transporter ATP-binding protein [uncultured Defluviicoccus sp.]VUX45523.1 ABC transporter ATP-binding protein [Candidatus Defluviicoccus seviourii]
MTFTFSIPTPEGEKPITVEPGSSVIFVGANGGGKTRLAVHIEEKLGLKAHRISAHRALALNPNVPKIPEHEAHAGLRTGYTRKELVDYRIGHRWQQKPSVFLLNDYDYLIQALFAEQSNASLRTHRRVRRVGLCDGADPTKFEVLEEIWQKLLPQRELHISGDNIEVSAPASEARYSASEMSDGERAIFYLIGQALVAEPDSLLIIDEPELHVHRSIMAKLWDELEAARPDCAFVFITHDLEFAASRVAQKFVLHDYGPKPEWTIQEVPEDSGFDEETTTLILGSRRNVLFVEGSQNSLDQAIYRCCYPDWTVVARGSCEEVIHAVATMRSNLSFTRVTCVGIVDGDGREADEIDRLKRLGVAVLPVAEIENIILLPEVSRAIAESEGYTGNDLENRLNALTTAILASVSSADAIEAIVVRYCKRRIDHIVRNLELGGTKSVQETDASFKQAVSQIDILVIAQEKRRGIEAAAAQKDILNFLKHCDHKGMFAIAARHFGRTTPDEFQNWLTRVLRNGQVPALTAAIREALPNPTEYLPADTVAIERRAASG